LIVGSAPGLLTDRDQQHIQEPFGLGAEMQKIPV
jgi:hypothetical protein